MKYIRDKHCIMPTELPNGWKLMALGSGIEIIKQADTIEELCDEFVFGNVIISLKEAKRDCEIGNVYGAIWTDKGLKYVAKMNEKGEFELL